MENKKYLLVSKFNIICNFFSLIFVSIISVVFTVFNKYFSILLIIFAYIFMIFMLLICIFSLKRVIKVSFNKKQLEIPCCKNKIIKFNEIKEINLSKHNTEENNLKIVFYLNNNQTIEVVGYMNVMYTDEEKNLEIIKNLKDDINLQ